MSGPSVTMHKLKIRYIFGSLIGLLILVAVLAGLRVHSSFYRSMVAYSSHISLSSRINPIGFQRVEPDLPSAAGTNGLSQSNVLELPGNSQSNVLELSQATPDFVG